MAALDRRPASKLSTVLTATSAALGDVPGSVENLRAALPSLSH
jgi:hypothetical protein